MDLSGRTAMISGGLGDIGAAIARRLARYGANVAIGDIRPAKDAEDLLAELTAHQIFTCYDQVDVADAAAVAGWVAEVERRSAIPDLIIPNAAIVTLKNWNEVTPEEWTQELAINLSGGFYLAQTAARRLVKAGLSGRIVFVGSWAAHAPHPNIVAYSVAKAGLRMLMRCLALELAPHGVIVNEVAPGYVDAGLSGRIFEDNPGAREAAVARVPGGELIHAEEVAVQVAHLCDPENRHMIGETLVMDGGLSLVTAASRSEFRKN